jgi:hypothetical protein
MYVYIYIYHTHAYTHLHTQDYITLQWVYIPEMIFINSIFGYLCCLILIKWTTNWDAVFVLNNAEVVSIPQTYCVYDATKKAITNLPCWTPPFKYDKAAASALLGTHSEKCSPQFTGILHAPER